MTPFKAINLFREEIREFLDFFLCNFPGRSGKFLRYVVFKRRFKSCGKNVSIPQSVYFSGYRDIELGNFVYFSPYNLILAKSNTSESKIKIGNNVSFNFNVMLNADVRGEIIVEDNALIGPNVVLRASGHRYEDLHAPIREQGHHKGKIVIKNGAWLSANAVILPNVTIGRGVIVAAGAVVTNDVNDFEIVGGVPAVTIGTRLEKNIDK